MPTIGAAVCCLRERAGRWKLQQWFPGLLMDRCAKIPNTMPQGMLCLWLYENMGEVSSRVFAGYVSRSPPAEILLNAHYDTRAHPARCGAGVTGQAWLQSIDALHSSSAAPYFAIATVTYVKSKDPASACVTTGVIRFRLVGGKVTNF